MARTPAAGPVPGDIGRDGGRRTAGAQDLKGAGAGPVVVVAHQVDRSAAIPLDTLRSWAEEDIDQAFRPEPVTS